MLKYLGSIKRTWSCYSMQWHSRQSCASNFVATAWGRLAYGLIRCPHTFGRTVRLGFGNGTGATRSMSNEVSVSVYDVWGPFMCFYVCEQSFSNTDLVDEEPVLMETGTVPPQWKCYAKYISAQQVLLIFLPATYTGNTSKQTRAYAHTNPNGEDCVSYYLVRCLWPKPQHSEPNCNFRSSLQARIKSACYNGIRYTTHIYKFWKIMDRLCIFPSRCETKWAIKLVSYQLSPFESQ